MGNVRNVFDEAEVYQTLYLLPDKETSPSTNGAWRIQIDADGNLEMQRRESGSWVTKLEATA